MPPSINMAYVNARGKGRVKSKEYVQWERENEHVNINEWYRIIGDDWLEVRYTFYFPLYTKTKSKKVKDLFNYEKCLTDFLTKKIDWFEDHKIKLWIVQKIDCANESVDVEIRELI